MSNLNTLKFADLINGAFRNPDLQGEFFKVLQNHIKVTENKLFEKKSKEKEKINISNPDKFDISKFSKIPSKIDRFLENNYNFSDKGIKKLKNNEINIKSFLSNVIFFKDTYQYIVRIKDEINKRIENENKEEKDQDKLLLIKDYDDLIKFFNIFNIKEEEIKNEVTNNKFPLKFDINKYFIKELRKLIFSEDIIFHEELKEEIKQLEYREKFLNASIRSFNQEDPNELREEELERSEFIKDSGRIFYINSEEKIKNFTLGDFFIKYIKHIIFYKKEEDINNIFSNSKEKGFILEEILDNIEEELNIKFIEEKEYLTEILNLFIKDVIINKNIFSNLSQYSDEFKGIFNMKEDELKSLLDKISNLIQPVSLQLNQTSDPEGIKQEKDIIPGN